MWSYEKIRYGGKTGSDKSSFVEGTESARGHGQGKINEVNFVSLVESSYPLYELTVNNGITKGYSLEEEDANAFAGIGEDLAVEDDDTGDTTMDTADNKEDPFNEPDDPFGDIGGDDMFSGDSSDPDEGTAPKKLTLSRAEALNQKFDMSKIVRKDFPAYILKLKEIVSSAIDIVDKKNVHSDLSEAKQGILDRYREVLRSIESYLSVIDSETYEDIFTTYVSFWSILNNLKKASNNLT